MVRTPSLQYSGNSSGEWGHQRPPGMENPWGGGGRVQVKESSVGRMDIIFFFLEQIDLLFLVKKV